MNRTGKNDIMKMNLNPCKTLKLSTQCLHNHAAIFTIRQTRKKYDK